MSIPLIPPALAFPPSLSERTQKNEILIHSRCGALAGLMPRTPVDQAACAPLTSPQEVITGNAAAHLVLRVCVF